ncbi:phage tail protein [Ewingella sp. S1.OA.A_B6]
MSQTVITEAFEQWKAQQATDNKPVVLDEFVLANVPGLDPSKAIDRKEGLPPAAQIVYRQTVSKTGLVNDNAVVYSVTMGADVGDFAFNWIGLVNKATGTVAMIVHAPVQSKVKNANGQQGNVLTRSFLMEYSGAVSQTLISTPAASWQIDFTARLAGMDEALRLANLDSYGDGAFFDAGFLVAKTGSQHFVTQGLGYVSGLRASLAENTNIAVATKPTKVWADVSFSGTLTSAYQTAIKFTVAPTLVNYTTNGVMHYVFALASIDAAGVITDLRPKGSLDDQQGSKDFLRKDQSLAELKALGAVAQAEARKNIAALAEDGTAVAATKLATARKIAGVAFDGTQDINLTPDSVGALPSGGTAVAANKLATARKIAGVAFDGSKDISLTAANVGAVQQGGGVGMSNNVVRMGWDGAKLLAQVDSLQMGALYSEYNKPTSSDVGALPAAGGDAGYVDNAAHYRIKPGVWEGAGAYASQYANNIAPFMVPSGFVAMRDASQYHPIVKGIVETKGFGYGTAISLGALTSGAANFAQAAIHVIGDNGISQAWTFNPADGAFRSGGDIVSGLNIVAGGGVYESGGAVRAYSPNYRPSPDAIGAIARDTCTYAGFAAADPQLPYMRNSNNNEVVYLARQDWTRGNFATIAWANNDLRNDIYNWVTRSFVTSVRLAGRAVIADTGGRIDLPAGCVFTGMSGSNYNPQTWAAYSAIQIWLNGGWVTIGTA